MNEKIALIIVCHNKKDDVIRCLESVFASTITNYDVIFIDNASTDGSQKAVKKRFADNIKIIANDKNNGAGAGFNDGLRYAIKNGYKYAMTLDHDIILDSDAIEILYNFLKKEEQAAAAFSKFCYMDAPETIQFATGSFDKELFSLTSPYANAPDSPDIPEVIFCDCFISGAVMFRLDALKRAGLYKEEYFIYGEDDELGLRLNKMGYKVAFCSKSRVLHKRYQLEYVKKDTMATYYNRRNRISMIVEYIDDADIERYCNHLVNDLFMLIYSCSYQNKINTMKTAVFACDDALNAITGKAAEGRILEADAVSDRLAPIISGVKSVLIMASEDFPYKRKCVKNLADKINSVSECDITIVSNDKDLPVYANARVVSEIDESRRFDVRFYICPHIFKVSDFKEGFIYADEYTNVAITKEDAQYCKDFKSRLELFYSYTYPLFLDKIKRLRESYIAE